MTDKSVLESLLNWLPSDGKAPLAVPRTGPDYPTALAAPPPGRGKGLQQRFRFRDNVVHREAKLFKQLLRRR